VHTVHFFGYVENTSDHKNYVEYFKKFSPHEDGKKFYSSVSEIDIFELPRPNR